MAISDWPAAERPRERLAAHGAQALSDAELVALFLRTGVRGKNAVALARDLLAAAGGLSGLFRAPGPTARVPGFGPAKRAQLGALLEVARRVLAEELRAGAALTSPEAVRDYLRMLLGGRDHEVFVCLWLDAQHRVIRCEELFRGTIAETRVYPREVVKAALAANAAAVIFAHNHPSGAAEPSRADELLTRSLKQALALVEVRVLDHFIVAGHAALSFAERGLL